MAATLSCCCARVKADDGQRAPKWPRAVKLIEQLEAMDSDSYVGQWAAQTVQQLELLAAADSIGAASNTASISRLKQQLSALEKLIVRLTEQHQRAGQDASPASVERAVLVNDLHRVHYRIARRIEVWERVYKLARQNFTSLDHAADADVVSMLQTSRARLNMSGVDPEWRGYLLSEEIEIAFNGLNPDEKEQRKTARKALARQYSPILTREQRQFVKDSIGPQVEEILRVKATGDLDFERLLKAIELLEARNSGVASYVLNDQYQNMRWSDSPELHDLADVLDLHYRNANVRLTVSKELLNRMIPAVPTTAEPFSDNILGAQVHGENYVSNHLSIGFIPDPNRIHLNVETTGEVNSNTLAHKSGFTVANEGVSRFQVFKRLVFDRDGVESDRPIAFSESSQRMVGLHSKLDAIPIFGWVAKRLARQQIEATAPETKQYMKNRLESEAKERMQDEVNSNLAQLRMYLYKNLMQPLIAMELEPAPIQMSTTAEQLVMRYRLAGRDQMGAFTSRPQELESSLLSMQIHQSAINNLLMRIDIDGKKFDVPELRQHLTEVFGLNESAAEPDSGNAEFEFEKIDPMRFDFQDGLVKIQLKFQSLKLEKGKGWKDLTVTVSYRPVIVGTKIHLVQQQKVRIQGKRLRIVDQVPIASIFNNVFKQTYQVESLPAQLREQVKSTNLEVQQLVIGDGWLGFSLAKRVPPVVKRTAPANRATPTNRSSKKPTARSLLLRNR